MLLAFVTACKKSGMNFWKIEREQYEKWNEKRNGYFKIYNK